VQYIFLVHSIIEIRMDGARTTSFAGCMNSELHGVVRRIYLGLDIVMTFSVRFLIFVSGKVVATMVLHNVR